MLVDPEHRRARILAAGIVLALVTPLPLGVPPAAASAYASTSPTPIGLSTDGVIFAANIPDPLFSGVTLVPGGTAIRSFWVRNQQGMPGNLAVAVRDVSGTDALLLQSLTISATAEGQDGRSVRASDVAPCAPLLNSQVLAASGVARVDIAISLSDALNERQVQGETGGFDITLTLTSTDAPAPDGCTPQPLPRPSPDAGGAPAGPGYSPTVTVNGVGDGTAGTPTRSATATPSPQPTAVSNPPVAGRIPAANTDRFYQEYFVAWWVVASVLGGLFAWYRDRRRRRMTK